MALGKIKADTLEHSTAGSVDTQYVVNGSAKSWVNFNGSGTVAIRDSYNVSSLADSDVGIYTLSWSNSFANDDYSSAGASGQNSNAMVTVSCAIDTTAPTTSASLYNTNYENGSGGRFDSNQVTIQVLGDLA
jgi:hypothetical protein